MIFRRAKNGQALASLAKLGINQPKLDWPVASDGHSSNNRRSG
jgi:hypothetical protein